MKYRIEKNENNEFVMTVLIDSKGNVLASPREFNYPEFVNFLYFEKGKKIEFEFDGLDENETKKINSFMEQVYKIFSGSAADSSNSQ